MSFAALRENLLSRPFFYLLISLVGVFVFYGLVSDVYGAATPPMLVRLLGESLVVCVLVSGLLALLKEGSVNPRLVIGLVVVSFLTHVARFVFPVDVDPRRWIPAMTIDVLFYFLLSGAILATLMRARRVTADMILGAIATYFLLAIAWGYLYVVLEIATGYTNLQLRDPVRGFHRPQVFDCMYFSFTTMTTLGYGDIAPKTGLGKALAVTQAVLGQVYLAVLVARLVGIQLAQSITTVTDEE